MKKQSQPLTPRTQQTTNNPDKVKVSLRIRPFISSQQPQQFITLVDQNVISINKTGIPSLMKFNDVRIQTDMINQQICSKSQQKMFEFVLQSVKQIFQGIDSTIFAYGQTGAGKTYTIIGDCPQSGINIDYKPFLISNNKGILIRAIQYIIGQSRKKRDSRITISFFQVYNQKIYDLLTNIPKPLDLRQGRNGQISIPGLIFVEVTDIKQSLSYIAQGLKNRVTCSTSGNIKSSRSHSIFHIKCQKLKIDKKTNQHQIIVSNLRIVDLAGSQKFNIPSDISQNQRQIRLTQLKSINGSLSKLGHCISALTSHTRTHIPFRDSKLTRILSQSLMGSSKIKLIVCVSPSISAMNQTASTLQFADRVKKAIFQRPNSSLGEKKKMIQFTEYQAVVQQLQKQKNLRQQLQRILKSSTKLTNGQLQLIRQNDRLRQQVIVLKQQLKVFKNRTKLTLDISRSKSRSIKKIDNYNYNIHNNTNNHHGNNHSTNNIHNNNNNNSGAVSPLSVNNSPIKGTSSKSVIQYQSKLKHSIDIKSVKKQSNGNHNYHHYGHKKNPSDLQKTQKSSFQNRVKKFMQKSDIDKQLQEKVKQRLKQIRKQIVNHRQWVQKSQGDDLWKNNQNNHNNQNNQQLVKKFSSNSNNQAS